MATVNTAEARPNPRRLLHFIACGFGSGLMHPAPGTWGSLAAIPFILALQGLSTPVYALILLLSTLFGIWVCQRVSEDLGVDDHPAIVWDEFVGMGFALFCLPAEHQFLGAALGFGLFRFFDVVKPGPVGWLDRNLTGGMGIMLDDVLAGIFAAICLQLAFLGWPWLV